MKALTLTQPWATLVALDAKQVETRSWFTNYRGPIAIHAAKGMPAWAVETCYGAAFRPFIKTVSEMPRGAVIATAVLTDCIPTLQVTARKDWPGAWVIGSEGILFISEQEKAFGDYSHGRFAWTLLGIKPLPEPIPAKGALGLWEWTALNNEPDLALTAHKGNEAT